MDRHKAEKLLKRGLTSEYIFSHSDEDVQKEFEGVESAVKNLIGEITSKVKSTNMDDFLEDSVYSDKKFILLLKNFSFGFKDVLGFGVQSCKCWGLHGLSKLCLNSKELI